MTRRLSEHHTSETTLHVLYDECRRRVASHEERVARYLRIAAVAEYQGLRGDAPRTEATNSARKLVRARAELAEVLRALSDATTEFGVSRPLAEELAQALRTKYRPRYTSPGRHGGNGRSDDPEHSRAQVRERKRRYDEALRATDREAIDLELDNASPGEVPEDLTWEDVVMDTLRELQTVREEAVDPSESRATRRARVARLRALRQELKWLGVPTKSDDETE